MSGAFTVPFSSSPPSTPDSHKLFGNGKSSGIFSLASNPSTTPAGPPPSFMHTLTPAGAPPPSSIFNSSQLASSNRSLVKESSNNTSKTHNDRKLPASKASFDASGNRYNESTSTINSLDENGEARTFTVPDDDTSVDHLEESNQEDESEDEVSRESEGDDPRSSEGPEDDSMLNTSPARSRQMNHTALNAPRTNGYNARSSEVDWANSDFMSPGNGTSPKSTKRLRNSLVTFDASIHEPSPVKRRKTESALPAIVDRMSRRLGVAALMESDELILDTESSINRLYETTQLSEDPERALELALPLATMDVCKIWRRSADQERQDVPIEDEVILGIGPNEDATPLQKAAFIAPLILELHHPPAATGKQASASSRIFRPSQSINLPDPAGPPTRLAPIPKVLGDWLENHHNPYVSAAADLQMHLPNPTAHTNYWDILLNMLLRGNIFDVVRTLKRSNFKYAHNPSYDESVCKNIATFIGRAAEIFQECPILQDEDWDVSGIRWGVFRTQLEKAIDDLKKFAEGSNQISKTLGSQVDASTFGLRGTASPLGLRKTNHPLPAVIYENLKAMYGILLGRTPEIVSSAQNWVEATLGLTIWWDGEDDDEEIAVGSLSQSRRSWRRSQIRGNRTVDISPAAAYLRRLSTAIEKVTDDDNPELFQINSNNMVEVGLATVFEGNVEGVISLLRGWSLPIASAVAAIANIGGWLEPSVGAEAMPDFDESDLMVLSYIQREQGLTFDGILVDYAEKLSHKVNLRSATAGELQGWEVSMQVLIRLNEEDTAMKNLRQLVQRLPLTSESRVDRVLQACHGFNLDQEASSIAERYADSIASDTELYGTAIIYYARARRPKKVRHVLDVLISYSLVESRAFPAWADLDLNLRRLIEKPQDSLADLDQIDSEAAQLIHLHLTGYATLRKFYDLRDQDINLKDGQRAILRPIARRKATVSTLVAVINSAADNIHGGLYDEDRDSIVRVDGLLVLLGEATVFVNKTSRDLSLPQCFDILKAVEDLETVASRVYEQCEECLKATLTEAYGSQRLADHKEMLKKSISNITSSSGGFSLIGNSMTDSETRESTGSSGVMIQMVNDASMEASRTRPQDQTKRGWDWRKSVHSATSGKDLLRSLRLGLAKDIARGWVDCEEVDDI